MDLVTITKLVRSLSYIKMLNDKQNTPSVIRQKNIEVAIDEMLIIVKAEQQILMHKERKNDQ
jgi:hypothetical protein